MKVSIVTVVYNNVDTISSCIESVIEQDYPDVEHIVIDGQSNDGTLEVIQQYAESIDVLVSEADEGLYDALNKGISVATGDIVGILHADDLFAAPDSISQVVSTFCQQDVDGVYGDLVFVDREEVDKVVRVWKSGSYNKNKLLKGWMPPHPTFYVKNECIKQYGLYDTSFTCSADYDWMLRYLYKNELTVGYVEHTLVRMRAGGISNGSIKKRWKANQEDALALKKNDISSYVRLLKPLRKIGQFPVSSLSTMVSYVSFVLPLVLLALFSGTSAGVTHLPWVQASLATLFSWAIVTASIPSIVKIAQVKHLMDSPNNRSSHESPTPTLGGIAIFAALLLSLTLWVDLGETNRLQYIIGAITLIFFTGLKDDMLVIAPSKKFMAQFFSAGVIIFGADLPLDSLHGVLGIGHLASGVSIPLTMVLFVLIVNAYNLVDGIDGLASLLGMVAATFFGGWFFIAGYTDYAILAFITVGALVGFIKYNFSQKHKIFLGDTGSLIIGVLCATMALQFIKLNGESVGSSYHFHNALFVALAVLGVAVFDVLRVFLLRIYQGKSPFHADRNHVHHLLLDLNFSHKKATIFLGLGNGLLILVAVSSFTYLQPTVALMLVILEFTSYLLFCQQLRFSNPKVVRLLFIRYIRFQDGRRAVRLSL